MSAPSECLRCKGPMHSGYVLDRANYNLGKLQEWVEGPPNHSVWSGLKTDGHDTYNVMTYRCEKCGYLESYATERAKS